MIPVGIVRGTLHPQRVIVSGKRGLLGETKRNPVEAGICQRSSAGSLPLALMYVSLFLPIHFYSELFPPAQQVQSR